MCSIIFPITYYYISYTYFSIFITTFTLILLLIDLSRKKSFYIKTFLNIFLKKVFRNYEINELMSATYMLLSFTIITFTCNKPEVLFAMLVVIFSDSIAALIGIKYGHVTLMNDKTLEGSFAFIITTVFILSFINIDIAIYQIIIVCIISTITELFTPTRYDNFTVPIASALSLGLFA